MTWLLTTSSTSKTARTSFLASATAVYKPLNLIFVGINSMETLEMSKSEFLGQHLRSNKRVDGNRLRQSNPSNQQSTYNEQGIPESEDETINPEQEFKKEPNYSKSSKELRELQEELAEESPDTSIKIPSLGDSQTQKKLQNPIKISTGSTGKKIKRADTSTLKRKKSGTKKFTSKPNAKVDKSPALKSPTNVSIKAQLLAKNMIDGPVGGQDSIPTIEKQGTQKEVKKTKRKKKLKKKVSTPTNKNPLALMELYNTKKQSLKKLPKVGGKAAPQ